MSNSAALALFNGSYLGRRPTGIGVVASELVKALDPERFPLLDPLGGSRPGSISIPSNLMPDFGRKGHMRRLIWTQIDLPSLLKRNGVDFLFSPLPEAPLLCGVRSVVLAHDLLPLRFPRLSPLLGYHLAYVPLVLHSSEVVLCNSEATAREVRNRLGVPFKKLITIPLGINRDNHYPMNLHRKPFFLVLGRHDPHKNISMVLKSISLIKNKEIQIKIVGPHDSRYTPKLMKFSHQLGISERCTWIPWVSDKEKLNLLNTCQALVNVSLWEGFGLPALEAIACNTPVITSKLGAIGEVVGDAGLFVNPKDPRSISSAMQDILSDSKLIADLNSKGKNQLERYTWEGAASIVTSTFESLQ